MFLPPHFENTWAKYMDKGPIQAAHTHPHQQWPWRKQKSIVFRPETNTLALHKGGGTDPSLARTMADTVPHFSNKSECLLWYRELQAMLHSLILRTLCVKTDNQLIWNKVRLCHKNFHYLLPMGNKLKVMHLTIAIPATSPVGSARSTAAPVNLWLL